MTGADPAAPREGNPAGKAVLDLPAASAARHSFRLALAALFLGAFGTSTSAIFIKLSELPPTATGFYRVALSAPFLYLWLRWERPRRAYRPPTGWRERGDLVLAALFFGTNSTIWCWSVRYTTAANALLISNLTPLVVAVAAFFFMRERFSRAFIVGMMLAMLGGVALVFQSLSIGGDHAIGDLLAFSSCFFWGGYLIRLQSLRDRFTTATIMTWVTGVSALLILTGALLNGEQLVPRTLGGWADLLALALVSQLVGQSLIAYAMAQLPASFTSVGLLVQPIYGMLIAWPVIGEQPTLIQILAGAMILFGIGLARRVRK